ncbi:hypothetical protein B0T25DRAFT_250253 [Lasiosphaeria hispida]|uniref:Uncharacterized protein n=1 Tax=Lasiosphaeria hispida TaxID=260671 RepID=A0AAJ0HFI5_9PEZI|nr:hypothetical protein B0T25DRAFT_250253 [Lasiosphaeria hispida]
MTHARQLVSVISLKSLRSLSLLPPVATQEQPTSITSFQSQCTSQSSYSTASKGHHEPSKSSSHDQAKKPAEKSNKKTQAELDEELRQKMEGIAGDGGSSGVEYEDGQPVTMKRSVRNNMFRYI